MALLVFDGSTADIWIDFLGWPDDTRIALRIVRNKKDDEWRDEYFVYLYNKQRGIIDEEQKSWWNEVSLKLFRLFVEPMKLRSYLSIYISALQELRRTIACEVRVTCAPNYMANIAKPVHVSFLSSLMYDMNKTFC